MTDIHLTGEDRLLYGISPKDRLDACFRHIKTHHADADFVVITGDIANNGNAEAYRQLHDTAKESGLTVFVIPGNHDDTSNMCQILPEFSGNLNEVEAGVWRSSFIISEAGAFVFLDTTSRDTIHGMFDDNRAKILKDRLTFLNSPHVFLFMHHPPFEVGIPSMDMIRLLDPEPLYSALAPFKSNIRHIFLGHLHKTMYGSWRGIPFSVIRSTVHQVSAQYDPHDPDTDPAAIVCCDETPEYSVVRIGDDQVVCNAERFVENIQTFLWDE